MLRTTISLLALLGATQAFAQVRIAYKQPSAATMVDVREDDEVISNPVRAANKARQNAFDRRIADSSDRAVKSVCANCSKTASLTGKRSAGLRSVPAQVTSDGIPIDDPSSAPAE